MQRPSIAFSWPLTLTLLAGCSQSTTPSGSPPATTEPVSSTPVTAPAATPAEGIIADHIRAMGGAEAVARIKTMHLTGQVSGSSGGFAFSGTTEETYDLAQDRGYRSMEMTGFFRREGWSGEVGWTHDTQNGVVDTAAEELMANKLIGQPGPLVALVAERGAGAFKEMGEREWNGQQCTVVTAEGFSVEFYLNQETKLIEGISVPGTIDVTFADYRAVEGVPLAGKRTLQVSQLATTVTYVIEATELNGQIDVARFDKPADEAAQVATAGATQPSGDTQETGAVTAEQVIQSMDANGDGKITKDEASEDLNLFFDEIDANGDGGIDVQEAQVMVKEMQGQPTTAQPSATPPQGEMTAAQLISFMDKNGDGKIAQDEANDQLKPAFAQFDQNKDGFLDSTEAQTLADIINGQQAGSQQDSQKSPPPPKGLTGAQLISFMDKNGDGKIAKDEANEQLKPFFDQQDQNKDGFIDAQEAQAIADFVNSQQSE